MGISISNATSSAITKYSESLRSGEPDWSMIPSAGKSNKSQAEFVSEIKELAQRAANTTSKTELESIHRQRTRLCAEYISDVSPDRRGQRGKITTLRKRSLLWREEAHWNVRF